MCRLTTHEYRRLNKDISYLKIAGLCYIYEPHFSEDDKMMVEKLGCHLIEHNEVK